MLKCRDAIENLHAEIEEERNEKVRLQDEIGELQRFVGDLQLVHQEKNFKIQKLTEEHIQMQSDIHVFQKEKERITYERDDFEHKVR